MKLHNSSAQIFIPDGTPVTRALQRITHLAIGAHQDDLEFMAVSRAPMVLAAPAPALMRGLPTCR